MLFVRTYHGMLGGHLKVFDYMHHVKAEGSFEPVLFLTPDSTQSPLEWLPGGTTVVDSPIEADAYFVGGFNWQVLDAAGVSISRRPVVNLLQGLRHVAPGDPRGEYLSRPALRICVSPAVYDGVLSAGHALGPVALIRNGVDLKYLSQVSSTAKSARAFIAGMKSPQLARTIAAELRKLELDVDLCCEALPRSAFLERMAPCDIAVTLPGAQEGFFLPAIEAMAMRCATVLPHCLGASSYCMDGVTCLSPESSPNAIVNAVTKLRANPRLREAVVDGGVRIAAEHSLERERSEFVAALRKYVNRHDLL